MKFRITLFVSLIFAITATYGQDIHFSQYYASPLTLNPAMTGGFNGKVRAVANYRNQWFSFLKSASYTTYSGSVDAPILRNKLRYDRLGIGMMVFNDRAGAGALSNFTAMVGASYHKVLDEQNRYSLALGAHFGITQRRIDFTKLTFESQFDPDLGFVLPNQENVDRSSFIYPDFTIGLLFRGRFTNTINGYIGGSMFHLHKPKEYFLSQNGEVNRLSPRFLAHGGVDFEVGEHVSLTPGFMYLVQNTASEITAGMAFGYKLNEFNTFYLGAWYRIFDNDAFIAMVAYEYDGIRVGLSYDINVSDLRVASSNQGAVELSVIYIYGKEKEQRLMSPVNFCPKF